MGKRKPAIMLTAGTLAVATLLSVGVTANAIENIPTPTATQSESRTASIYPEGAWISVDGEWLESFDPSDGLDDEDTGYVDSATWKVKGGSIQLHDLPAGWTVGTQMRVNRLTGEWSAFYLVEDETQTYRYYWYFDGADGITHTVDEMRGFTLTLNGEPVDCDPTGNVDVHHVYPSDYVGYEGAPANWTVVQRDFTENGVDGYEYVAYPTDTESPVITYRFWYDAPSPADELEGVTAYLSDGSPVTGFDPTVSGTFDIPYGYDVELRNVPAGWTVDPFKKENGSWSIELEKGNGERYFDYLFAVTDSYTWTYTVDQLQNVNATLPDGTPIDGFGWRGGRWTLPKGTTGVNLTGVPDGWNRDVNHDGDTWTVTVSSPDGSVSVDYIFDVPHTYTAGELSGITATADGTPVDGFTPTQSGTWTVPYGSTVNLKDIPDDWVTTHEDGTLTWTVTAPDNTVSVTYTFEYTAKPASRDDLKTVTATVNGEPVKNFDPVNGGTFTVPAGTTSVDLAGIPEGWSSTPLTDGRLGFTLTSKDGTLSVEYVFTPETVTHTVTFDSDGGTPVDTQTVNDGDKATEPDAPTRDGYTFKGWWNGDTAYDFAQPVTDDLTLTAHWEQNAPVMHTVTFDTQGGTPVASQTVTENGTVTRPADPTRDGYTFKGWQLGGADFDFTTPVTGDITLTAVWEENKTPTPVTHKVTFDTNGGSAVDSQTVDDGATAVKPADPTRDGYTFNGWTLDGKPFDFSQPVTGDITLEAQWEKNETPAPVTHTVRFRTNGGNAIPMQTVEDGKTVGRPADPTRPGHTFAGWLLDGEPYDFSTPVTGDIILDAAWEETPASDPLSGVTATVDDEPLDGFDPTKDGEYHVDADAGVRLSGLPEGWTATRRDTETGFSFTLTDGERTVIYTFVTDGRAEEPETPDTPQTPDADDGPDTPSDGRETPDADPAPGSDAGDGLASTGVSPAGPLAGMIALLGMALAVLRGRARR
ncbi:InlB B-repeat-containing protein [uncultured Bifidobacterium sp.]|uniref:InlB B-repeat-containing protein n=1 Tax=uncultured Bifidobacterium sp. TaxID=165187 RepID=UPI0027DD0A7F|nr:InlB B-repeat-containing protein [uncultured Bifidobacterium sp.]